MAILPENETTTFEEQVYVNPQVSLDESNAFIDNYRAAQLAKTNEIARETHDLGTDIPSNLGGLTGGTGYWTSRYQTPQTNQVLSNLRATAQAKALNDTLANEEAMWKNRYSNAQRAYQKRSAAAAKAAANPTTQNPTIEGDVVAEDNVETEGEVWQEVFAPSSQELAKHGSGLYTTTWNGQYNVTTDQKGNVISATDANGRDATEAYNAQSVAARVLSAMMDPFAAFSPKPAVNIQRTSGGGAGSRW